MKERDVEKYLVDRVKVLGGIAYKFSSPNRASVPDRICVLPGGILIFVECKRPGEKPTMAQEREINRLRFLGHSATWVDSKEMIDALFPVKSWPE